MVKMTKPDISKAEASFDPRLLKLIVPVKRREPPAKKISTARGWLLFVIDRVADSIVFGLDRIGDGLIFPIEKLLNLSTALYRAINRNAKN